MPTITYEDFKKLEFSVGEIVEAEAVPGSTNLLRLLVDIGTERRQLRAQALLRCKRSRALW